MKEIKIHRIIRSRRRTFALEITRNATLIVRAPLRVSQKQIDRLVFGKRLWIWHKQEEVRERYQRVVPKEFVNGEGFSYLGDTYRLRIVNNAYLPLTFDKGFQLSREYLSQARDVFINWYKETARWKISDRASWYASLSGLNYNKINITNAQKRWGSCSPKRNLSFAWRLIMAPLPVIDYVVVHELAHLEEKNHSARFWNKVKIMMPDCKKHFAWLRNNGHILNI